MDWGYVDISCPDCHKRLLHYHSRWFRKDVVRCPAKGCGFEETADVMLDAVGFKWQKTEEALQSERIRAKINAVHIKLDSIDGSGAKKALRDAIFKFHPDRNPKGLDANEVLMVLNKLKEIL